MSNEWVERAMELVEAYADKTSEYHHALRIDVGTYEAGATCVRAGGALRAHLESKEREHLATKALVKQLAEALKELSYACTDKAEAMARAALAAQQQYVRRRHEDLP